MEENRFHNFTAGEKKDPFDDAAAERELERLRSLMQEEAEQIPLPESLRSEHLLPLLDGITPGEGKPVPKVHYLREYGKFIACAACFVLMIFGVNRLIAHNADITTDAVTSTEGTAVTAAAPRSVRGEGNTAESYDEVYALLSSAAASSTWYANDTDALTTGTAPSDAVNDGMTEEAETAGASLALGDSSFAEGYTETNTQYEAVDEGDLLKTDGEYLYHLRYNADEGCSEVVIVEAKTLSLVSRTALDGFYYGGEVYVDGDTLAVVYSGGWGDDAPAGKVSDYVTTAGEETGDVIVPDWYESDSGTATTLLLYDISDRANPKETAAFRQSGSYVSSRLTEGVLYLVSNRSLDLWSIGLDAGAASVFPAVSCNGTGEVLSADCIYLPESLSDRADYCLVTAYDTRSGERETKAVLGSADNLILTGNTLILASNLYDGARSTGITRFTLGEGEALQYVSSGRVDGWIEGQFSLDVADGYLRIATTSYNDAGETENGVSVYDEDMNLVGSVTGLAEGERIYSVRYLGDTAYVVTFRETDPLFAVDLSDPENPTVLGQLKIPGFSEYLHPAGDGLLIGLGQNTATTSYGSVITDGLKLSLFDVSDPADPQEIDSVLLGNNGSSSEALTTHKAFLWDAANGRFGFPATLCRTYGATAENPWGTASQVSFDGYLVYTFDETGFTRVGAVESADGDDPLAHTDSADTIRRAAVVNGVLYTAAEGGVTAWDYSSFEALGTCTY